MRLDKPFGYQKIRLARLAVEPAFSAKRQRAQKTHVAHIVTVMYHYCLMCCDLFAELVDQFFSAGLAVASSGNENGDLSIRISSLDLL